jgi:hypothetical protein
MKAKHLASRSQHYTQTPVVDQRFCAVFFQVSPSGAPDPDLVRGPAGTTVSEASAGVYEVAFPFTIPSVSRDGDGAIFAWMGLTSTGATMTFANGAEPNILVVTTADLANGDQVVIYGVGPYAPEENFGYPTAESAQGAPALGNRAHYWIESLNRDQCFIPIGGTFSGGELTLDEGTMNVEVVKDSAGVWDLDIGIHEENTAIALLALDTSDPVVQVIGDPDVEAKVVRIDTGGDPLDDVRLVGAIVASWTRGTRSSGAQGGR